MTRRLILFLANIFTLPGLAYAQVDPGPPPVTAATVPTLAEAKSFIEENIVAASLPKCGYDPEKNVEGGARIELSGGRLLLSDGSTETRRSSEGEVLGVDERSSVETFNVVDVDAKIVRWDNGCQGARLRFECINKVNCVTFKRSFTLKHVDENGLQGSPNASSGTQAGASTPIGDLALTLRIITAFRFYQNQISKFTPRSAF